MITEFNPKRRRVIGDRKQLMVAKKAEMQKDCSRASLLARR